MTDCRKFKNRMDDFLDDEVSPRVRREFEDHLRSCVACATELGVVRSVIEAARSLPASEVPGRDLWPGIAAQLDDRHGKQRRRLRWWAVAAALIAAVGGGWIAGRWTSPQVPLRAAQDSALEAGDVRPAEAAADSFREDYLRARIELLAVLDSRRDDITPATMRSIEESIALIDRAIVDIEAALLENPDDRTLNRSLRLAYDRQLDVLETATRWTTRS